LQTWSKCCRRSTSMDLNSPTMVAAGRSTPCTMEPCQKNLHPLDGEHQQAQTGKSRSLRVGCFLYFAWCYFLLKVRFKWGNVRSGPVCGDHTL
jgi:hypothetical protein